MKIPGYKIEQLIGKGGSSSVYLAVQESLGRRVALKVMKKFDDRRQADRFQHEGRIIASLNHRNIITIHDVGTIGDRPFIAMEYLKGRSLKERIDEGLPLHKVLSLLEQMAACLHFVHRRGIIHRDIKPSNILFHADGTPKLTDFGIAKLIDSDQELTMAGNALGSPYYLSPEQAEGLPLDGRSDIYALGIVFYQMLTGQKPYAKNSAVETIVAHLTQPLPVLPGQFLAYQDLLEAMIAKRPEDRISSAKELVYRVREAKAGFPHDAHGAGDAVGAGVPTRLSHAATAWPGRPQGAVVAWAFAGLVASALVYAAVSWFSPGDATPRLVLGTADTRATRIAGPNPLPLATAPVQAAHAWSLTENSAAPPAADAVVPAKPASDPANTARASATTVSREVAHTVPGDRPRVPATSPTAGTGPVSVTGDSDRPGSDGAKVSRAVTSGPTMPQPAPLQSPVPTGVDAHDPPSVAHVAEASQPDAPPGPTTGPAAYPGSNQETKQGPDARSDTGPDPAATQQIDAWLQAAGVALEGLRLTRPADDNALAYYQQVLTLDPAHSAARAGIQSIADRYAGMARRAISRDDDGRARRYVRRGLNVQPGDAQLVALKEQLDRRAQAGTLAQAAADEPAPAAPAVAQSRSSDSIRGREGSGNMIEDFKGVWRAVFD